MAGFLPVKMKRKDLDEIYDEFSDFSLSSPARKIRRLDIELPPIMEEGPEFLAASEQPLPEEQFAVMNSEPPLAPATTGPPSSIPSNEERALVLYKPVNTHTHGQLFQSPGSSDISFRVNSDLLPGFKNQILWSGSHNNLGKVEAKASTDEKQVTNGNLAVVPWVPSQFPAAMGDQGSSVSMLATSEPMEAEEVEAMMEEDSSMGGEVQATEPRGMGVEGLQQWQQHCMTLSQPPQPATPVMWSW